MAATPDLPLQSMFHSELHRQRTPRHVSFAAEVEERVLSPTPVSDAITRLHRDLMLSGEHQTAQRVKDEISQRLPCDPNFIDSFITFLRKKQSVGTVGFLILAYVRGIENGLFKPPMSLDECDDEFWQETSKSIRRVLFQ